MKELTQITDEEIWKAYNKSISYEKAVLLVVDAQLTQDKEDHKDTLRAIGEWLDAELKYCHPYLSSFVKALKRGDLPEGIKEVK